MGNPTKYTDPSGHRPDDGCEIEGCSGNVDDWSGVFQMLNNYCQQNPGPQCESPALNAMENAPALNTAVALFKLIAGPNLAGVSRREALGDLGMVLGENLVNGLMGLAIGGDLEGSAIAAQGLVGNTGLGKPTIAAIEGGLIRTRSGWKSRPGYVQVTSQVLDQAVEMGFSFPASKYDPPGSPGLFYASHAEAQLSVAAPNSPIGVSNAMCPPCQAYFSTLAQYRGAMQVVADPYRVRFFFADGSIRVNVR